MVTLVICIVFATIGSIALILESIAWCKGRPYDVNSMVRGAFLMALAMILLNGEMDRHLTDRVTALEAQLAKQPATENQAEQK